MASRTSTDPIEILLEMGVDLDNLSEEEDYLSALMEAVNTLTIKNAKDPRISPLQQEIVKVRKKRKAADTRFKARKTKISAGAFKKGSATGTNLKPKALPTSALVLYQAPEAATEEEGGEKKKRKRKPKEKNLLKEIAKSVTNIADTLKKQYDLKKKFTEEERRRAEQQKRKLQEAGLEKRFEGILKTAQKIIAPIRSIFDRIIQFLTMVFLGKFLSKLVDWFTNPENQSKVKSIIRFLSDNWPKLLSAYIIFGTGLGKFSRFLVKVLARGAVRLAAATAGLLARLFGGRALGRFSRFLGKRGKLIAGGVEAVTTIFAFKALEDAFTKNLGPEESASIDNDIPVKGYSGGGRVRGELGNATPGKNMLGQANRRHQFEKQMQQRANALKYIKNESALQSKELSSGVDRYGRRFKIRERGGVRERVDLGPDPNFKGYEEGGEVDGPAGIDKVPAMLTDGEFVMSRGAVQKYGLAQLEAMNAAGGGTNKPKMMNGTVFAVGGGYFGDREKAPDKKLNPVEELRDRFLYGDRSLLNRAALGDTKGVLEALGIKIDNNTEAVKQNTKQRREDNYTLEGIVAGAVGLAQSLEQQAAGLYNQAMSGAAQLYDQTMVLTEQAQQFANELPAKLKEGYDSEVRRFYETTVNADRMVDAEAERYVTQAEFDKLSPEEQLDKLVIGRKNKDGVVRTTKTALTARNQERQTATIERLRKGLNSENPLERIFAGMMNEGMIALPSQMLKNLGATEGFDKAISGLTGGRIKKASAAMSGVEFVIKGLLGPLGNPLQTDASAMLEYNKPLMDFAIENNLVNSKGEYMVGKDSWSKMLGDKAYEMVKDPETGRMVRGEHLYDKMQRESMGSGKLGSMFSRFANYGLGQFTFSVDQESGKAKVTDSWDSNNSAAYYFGASEKALKDGNIGSALFDGLSGLLRVNQNSFFGYGDTGFANTLPGGIDITSRSGFQKALTSSPSSMQRASEQVANSTASKGYFSSTTNQFYPSYAEALKDPRVKAAAQVEETKKKLSFAPTQPVKSSPSMPSYGSNGNVTVLKVPAKNKTKAAESGSTAGSNTPNINAGNGDSSKFKIYGFSPPSFLQF